MSLSDDAYQPALPQHVHAENKSTSTHLSSSDVTVEESAVHSFSHIADVACLDTAKFGEENIERIDWADNCRLAQGVDGTAPGSLGPRKTTVRRLSLGAERRLRNRASLSSCTSQEICASSHEQSDYTQSDEDLDCDPGVNKTEPQSASQSIPVPSFREAVARTFRQINHLVRRQPGQPPDTQQSIPKSSAVQRRLWAHEAQNEESRDSDWNSHSPHAHVDIDASSNLPSSSLITAGSLAQADIKTATSFGDKSPIPETGCSSESIMSCPPSSATKTHPCVSSSIVVVKQARKTNIGGDTDIGIDPPRHWWCPRKKSDTDSHGALSNSSGANPPQPRHSCTCSDRNDTMSLGHDNVPATIHEGLGSQNPRRYASHRSLSLPLSNTPALGTEFLGCDSFPTILRELQHRAWRVSRRSPESKVSDGVIALPYRKEEEVDWSLIKIVRVEGGWVTVEDEHVESQPQILTETTIQLRGESHDLSCLGFTSCSYKGRDPYVTFVPQSPTSAVLEMERSEIMAYVRGHSGRGMGSTGKSSMLWADACDNSPRESYGTSRQADEDPASAQHVGAEVCPRFADKEQSIRRNTSGTVIVRRITGDANRPDRSRRADSSQDGLGD